MRERVRWLFAACGVLAFAGTVALLTERDPSDDEEVIRFPDPPPDATTSSSSSTSSTSTTAPAPTTTLPPTTVTIDEPVRPTDDGSDDDEAGPTLTVPVAAEPMPPRTEDFRWTADYFGPVWITLDTDDADPRTVTIRWGKYQRTVAHATAEPVTYAFTKAPPLAEDPEPNPVLTVTVDPGGGFPITFGQGPPPDGAVDVNPGWEEVPPTP